MLKIRFSRIGKKNRPSYRIIISEITKDTAGDFLEILGYYNPFTKVAEIKKERVLYWLAKGAKTSPTIHNLLISKNIIAGKKVKASKSKQKKKEIRPKNQKRKLGPKKNKKKRN